MVPGDDPLDALMGVPELRRKSSQGYSTYEGCMEGTSVRLNVGRAFSHVGGLGHETKSGTYKVGTEKAYHHLNRAAELFGEALKLRPSDPRGIIARAKTLIQLASTYQSPRGATLSLREATSILRDLVAIVPKSVSARETLAQACGLLSQTLLETDDNADDDQRVWEGEIGKLAREALQSLEDVAADRMDKMRDLKQDQAAEGAPSMAETFLALSAAAVTVSSLSTDLSMVDLHVELAEQALDQASNMATVAAAAKVKSSTSSANLITRVQLASGRSSLERLRHTFILGSELDEDDFRSLVADISILATECRERAATLKGSKAAAASTLAWEAIKQLGDAKVLYANLLRLVWRKRKPRRKSSDKNSRKLSSRSDNAEATIQEEDEDGAEEEDDDDDDPEASPIDSEASRSREPSKFSFDSRQASTTSSASRPGMSRKESSLSCFPVDQPVSSFTRPEGRFGGGSLSAIHIPNTGRRGSWLPTSGDALQSQGRRLSSMTAPLVGPDGISAWSRKGSVITLGTEEEAQGLIPAAQLAESAWQLLDSAVKQYKLALSLLSSSDLPSAQLARAKADTLTQISYASMFMASLAPRLSVALDKRTSLLVTSEVYATWSAREVGWSFLIEGTKEAQLADRRTNNWRADEAGKRAVMLLVRIWWHRAVTAEGIDVDTKTAAKDAVEVVVRRMKDREGVRDGDVMRFRGWLGRQEGGEMDAAEALFWRSVSRILRGGAGFVMS